MLQQLQWQSLPQIQACTLGCILLWGICCAAMQGCIPLFAVPSPKKLTATWSAFSSCSAFCKWHKCERTTALRVCQKALRCHETQVDTRTRLACQSAHQGLVLMQSAVARRSPTFLYLILKAAPSPIGMPSPMKAKPPSCEQHKPSVKVKVCVRVGLLQWLQMPLQPLLASIEKCTHQAMLCREHVHRASLPSADACLLAKQLCHDVFGWHILAQCVDVISVC